MHVACRLLCSDGMNKFRRTLGATTLVHDKVVNLAGQDIGRIEELMIDVTTGRVAYAVLSFGGFLGIGNKLFALPWSALTVDETKKRFVVNVTRDSLERFAVDIASYCSLEVREQLEAQLSPFGLGST